MNIFKEFTLLLLVFMFGCAHGTMRGSVVMKISDDVAHVCLGSDEVEAGDKVVLFKSVCGNKVSSCEKEKLGEGVIEKVLNEHYSVMRVNPGVQFIEGTIVEKW